MEGLSLPGRRARPLLTRFLRKLPLPLVLCFVLTSFPAARAASLSVAPVDADVIAPGRVTVFSLQNKGSRPLNAQVRIFKWSLENGKDKLTQTNDVIATPPIIRIAAGKTFKVRVARTAAAPVQGEESYRLVVDELPEGGNVARLGLNVAVRYVIPVFFSSRDAREEKIAWSIRSIGGRQHLVATNPGDIRVQVSELHLGGKLVAKGLAGYVLGKSMKVWPLPVGVSGGQVTARSSRGEIDAPAAR